MVNLASGYCYTDTHARRKDNVFNPKDEHVGIWRARACLDRYTHAGSDVPKIFEWVSIILSEGRYFFSVTHSESIY